MILRIFRRLMKYVSAILLSVLLLSSALTADAHPGRTDRYGGHYNRKTGEYHYHNSGYSGHSSSSTRTTKKKAAPKKTASTKSSSSGKKSAALKTVQPLTPQEAANEADLKLRANNFFLDDEIDRVYQEEQTPDVLSKLTEEQMRAIVAELNAAKEKNTARSQGFGATITDALEKSFYQAGVLNNMMLKARRTIAKKYGIQSGDIATIEMHIASAGA